MYTCKHIVLYSVVNKDSHINQMKNNDITRKEPPWTDVPRLALYTNIYTYIYMCIYIYIYINISLSLYIYIYTY